MVVQPVGDMYRLAFPGTDVRDRVKQLNRMLY